MWGETCRWASILSDPALVSVVYIAVKIPWVRRLSQYLEGQWDYGGVPCAVRALCEKLAVLHHREFGKFRRLKGRH